MAQVIDRYQAEAGGSSTMYYYRYPDNTSAATRIYAGEVIYLHADHPANMSGSFCLMVDPGGWIPWYHVQNITPVYRTVTDACTAPSALTLDASACTLTITGGAGGDLNALTGFGVSHRDRAINESVWREWSEDTVSESRIVSVSAESGMVRQYRVRTLGEAGEAYWSDYTVCETLLAGNTAASTPVILLPVAGAESVGAYAAFAISCPPEPDGDAMTLQRSVDGGDWADVRSLSASGGTVYDQIQPAEGSHTVRYRLMDANGSAGGEDGIAFTRVPLAWARQICTGDVIANRDVSFRSDVEEMLAAVNQTRIFYGRTPLVLPGTVGRFEDWANQLQAMQNAVNDCRTATGRSAVSFDTPSLWPKAQGIGRLRSAIEIT